MAQTDRTNTLRSAPELASMMPLSSLSTKGLPSGDPAPLAGAAITTTETEQVTVSTVKTTTVTPATPHSPVVKSSRPTHSKSHTTPSTPHNSIDFTALKSGTAQQLAPNLQVSVSASTSTYSVTWTHDQQKIAIVLPFGRTLVSDKSLSPEALLEKQLARVVKSDFSHFDGNAPLANDAFKALLRVGSKSIEMSGLKGVISTESRLALVAPKIKISNTNLNGVELLLRGDSVNLENISASNASLVIHAKEGAIKNSTLQSDVVVSGDLGQMTVCDKTAFKVVAPTANFQDVKWQDLENPSDVALAIDTFKRRNAGLVFHSLLASAALQSTATNISHEILDTFVAKTFIAPPTPAVMPARESLKQEKLEQAWAEPKLEQAMHKLGVPKTAVPAASARSLNAAEAFRAKNITPGSGSLMQAGLEHLSADNSKNHQPDAQTAANNNLPGTGLAAPSAPLAPLSTAADLTPVVKSSAVRGPSILKEGAGALAVLLVALGAAVWQGKSVKELTGDNDNQPQPMPLVKKDPKPDAGIEKPTEKPATSGDTPEAPAAPVTPPLASNPNTEPTLPKATELPPTPPMAVTPPTPAPVSPSSFSDMSGPSNGRDFTTPEMREAAEAGLAQLNGAKANPASDASRDTDVSRFTSDEARKVAPGGR